MTSVYIFVFILVVLIIVFTIWLSRLIFRPILKMHKAGSGVRTKFIVETTDNGYEYYKDKIEKWLNNYGYKRKNLIIL